MAEDHTFSDNTPPSDLTFIDKMLKSAKLDHANSPQTIPARPLRPPPDTPAEMREKALNAAEKRAPPPSPLRAAPPAPRDVDRSPRRKAPGPPGRGSSDSVDSQDIYDAPPLKPGRAAPTRPRESPKKSQRASMSQTPSGSATPTKRFSKSIEGAYKSVKSAVFPPLVQPETDSEDDEERDRRGVYMMSGGLQGNDRSERERSGRPSRESRPVKTKIEEDTDEEDETLMEQPLLDHHDAEAKKEGREGRERRETMERRGSEGRDRGGGNRGSEGEGSLRSPKKEIKMKRKHRRTTIGDNGRVISDSESEAEYYESTGPVGGCVVG